MAPGKKGKKGGTAYVEPAGNAITVKAKEDGKADITLFRLYDYLPTTPEHLQGAEVPWHKTEWTRNHSPDAEEKVVEARFKTSMAQMVRIWLQSKSDFVPGARCLIPYDKMHAHDIMAGYLGMESIANWQTYLDTQG